MLGSDLNFTPRATIPWRVALLSLVLPACTIETQPAGPDIETMADLEGALAEAGVAVTPAPNPSAPELGTVSQGLLVGNVPVQVYEYGSIVERRLVSDTIRAGRVPGER